MTHRLRIPTWQLYHPVPLRKSLLKYVRNVTFCDWFSSPPQSMLWNSYLDLHSLYHLCFLSEPLPCFCLLVRSGPPHWSLYTSMKNQRYSRSKTFTLPKILYLERCLWFSFSFPSYVASNVSLSKGVSWTSEKQNVFLFSTDLSHVTIIAITPLILEWELQEDRTWLPL